MNISDKFLQSKEFDRLVPQIQFISRVWDIPVVEQRGVRTVPNCAEDRRFLGAVLGYVVNMPVGVPTTGYGLDSTEYCGVPQVQYSDKVVDVPAVAVHRRWTSLRLSSDAVSQWEVPQIQFIAGVRGHPSCNRDGYGFLRLWRR